MKLLGAFAGLALLMAASPAWADVLVVYTGTVSSGADLTGVFGPPGSLAGDSFVVKYVCVQPDSREYLLQFHRELR
jgi:hypothetical protein